MAPESTSFVLGQVVNWSKENMQDDLWQFAVEFYAQAGIEAASLELQAAGGDVCVLLCALWLGRQGVAWEELRTNALQALAGPWQNDVITPLRTLRQQWRTPAQGDAALATLREQVKQLELGAERELLGRLQTLSAPWPRTGAQDAAQWLEHALPLAARAHHEALHRMRTAQGLL
jgi:uncharacterized protein (TIGR02444 family)